MYCFPQSKQRDEKDTRENFFTQLHLFTLTGCPLLYDTILCTSLLLKFPYSCSFMTCAILLLKYSYILLKIGDIIVKY